MALNELVVKLNLDSRGLTAGISSSEEQLKSFRRALDKTNGSVERAEKVHSTWGRKLRDSVIVLGLARNALLNLDAALLSLPRAITRANAEFERMNMLMRGLSNETGSLQDMIDQANRDQAFVIETSLTAPYDIQTVQDSFVKMRSVGIDPTTGALNALVDSVAKFGGTKEQLHRASIAIQQMAGKGVISMEELRQQLGEAVPDAIKIMARGVGLSMGELVDKISKGTVESQAALQALFRQMEIENKDAALLMSQTWDGTMSRLQTRIQLLYKEIGDAGAFDAIKEQLTFLTDDFLIRPEVISAAKSLGDGVASLISAVASGVSTIFQFKELIGTALTGALVFAIARSSAFARVQSGLSTALGSVRAMSASYTAQVNAMTLAQERAVKSAAMFGEVLTAQSAATVRATVAMTALGTAAKGLAASLAVAGRSLGRFMMSWNGLLLVLWGAYEVVQLFGDKSNEVLEDLAGKSASIITEEELRVLGETINKMETLKQKLADVKGTDRNAKADRAAILNEVQALEASLEAAGLNVATAKKLFDEAKANIERQVGENATRKVKIQAAQELKALIETYKANVEEVINDTSGIDRLAAKAKLDEELLNQINGYYDNLKAIEQKNLDELQKIDNDASAKRIAESKATLEAIEKDRQERLAVLNKDPGGINQAEQAAKKAAKAFDTYFNQLEVRYEKLKAKQEDSNEELAKFNTLLKQGKFGDLSEEEIKKTTAMLKSYSETKKAIEEAKDAAQEFSKVSDKLDRTARTIASKFAKAANQNPWLKNKLDADKYKDALQEIKRKLEAIGDPASKKRIEDVNAELASLYAKASGATIADIETETDKITNAMLPDKDRIQAEYNEAIFNLTQLKLNTDLAFSPEQKAKIDNFMQALDAQRIRALRTPLEELAEDWADTTTAMDEIWATTVTSITEELARGVVEGEFQFDRLLSSFAQMLVQMQLQAAAANIIQGIGGAASFTAFNGTSAQGAFGGGFYGFANGGIMTSEGALTLQKYAKGGIASSPQLALFGEGSQPEAYVPLPDGRTIPVTMTSEGKSAEGDVSVQVNVINESGQPVEAKQQGQPRFDGDKYILDVVMRGMSRPGDFRDSMRNSVR